MAQKRICTKILTLPCNTMKFLNFNCFFLCLLFVPLIISAEESSYQNDEYGIEFKYPSSWRLTEWGIPCGDGCVNICIVWPPNK